MADLDFQPDEEQDINAFAPTNPQNQSPGSQGTPLSPLIPKSAMPKAAPQESSQNVASAPQQSTQPTSQQVVNYKPAIDFQPDDTTPDTSAMQDYVTKNLQAYQQTQAYKDQNPTQSPAKTLWDAMRAGFQGSSLGLAWRDKMPDTVEPLDASMMMGIANSIGSLAGDIPAMMAGGSFGAGLGAGIGGAEGSVVPVAGTAAGAVGGAAIGTMAGAFAVPQALRKILIDHYQKGDITTPGEFAQRLMGTTWEAIKGATTGAATAYTGGLVSGPIAKLGTELATMTTVGSALEGKLPSAQDFVNGAIVLGGLHAVTGLAPKLRNIYAQTGETPDQVVDATNRDVQLKQDLLSQDPKLPIQAQPTELQHFSHAESTIPPTAEQGENLKPEIPPPEQQWNLIPKEESPAPPAQEELQRTPEEQEILSKIGALPEEEGKTFQEKFNALYANNVDWTDPLKVAYQAFKDTTGKELSAEDNPHIQARLFAGHLDQVRSILDNGFQDENGKFVGEGINQIYKDVPNDDQQGFDAYSMAKRAVELDDKGITPWSDFNREGAEKVISDGADKFEDLHQRRVKFQNDALQYGAQKGVIDPGIAKESIKGNQEYIPFSRVIPPDELTGGPIGSGKLIHKIEGSELDLKNPRQAIYDNVQAIIRRAEINEVRLKTMDNLSYEDENGKITNDFLREVPVEGSIKPNQMAIFRKGKMSALEGTPGSPLVIDSLKRLEGDKTSMGVVTKIAQGFSQAVRYGTLADPGFGFRHFFRSTFSSFFYTKTGIIPFYHPALALSEFMKGESITYKNWLYDGGSVAAMDSLEKNYISNGLQEADSKYPYVSQAWNLIKKPLDAAEAFIKMTDNLVRFTEYKRSLEQGASRDQAAFNSREVTPDYSKQGLQRSALRTATAFQSAHINSLDRMAQAFKEDPQGTILRMSVLAGISAMTWAVNRNDPAIQDLPDWQKDQYWNFHIPGTQIIFKLPKPWGPGILFGSGTERTLDAFFNKNPHAMEGFEKSLYDSVVPNIIPNIASPILDQMANKNLFNGRQLVNEQQQKMLPEMQYQPYTSEFAKQVGKVIGYVPFVKDLGPSSDPLASPAVVENYIRGWSGTLGGWVLKIADMYHAHSTNTGASSVSTVADYPILNEFMTRFPSMKDQPIQTFYQNLYQTTKVLNSIREAKNQGNAGLSLQFMQQYPEFEVNLKDISKTISNGNKFIEAIEASPNIDPVQKRQLVDTALFQIESAAKMGNKMMDDFNNQKQGNATVH